MCGTPLVEYKAFLSRSIFLILELVAQRGVGGFMVSYVVTFDTSVVLASWAITTLVGLTFLIELVAQRGVGGFMVSYVVDFDTSVVLASWAVTILVGLTFLMAPVMKKVIELSSRRCATIVCGLTYSCCFILLGAFGTDIWQVFVLHIIAGCSASLVNIATYMALGDHFGSDFGAAHSGAMFIAALSGIVSPLMMEEFEGIYGLRWALVLFGAVALHFVVAGVCMTQDGTESAETKDNSIGEDSFDRGTISMLRAHPHVLVHLVFYAITWILSVSFSVVLYPFGIHSGLPDSSSSLLIIWYSIGSLFGRCSIWIIFQTKRQNMRGVILVPVGAAIVVQLVSMMIGHPLILAAGATFVGMSTGSMNNWGSSMVRDIACDLHFGSTAAWVTASAGIGATIAGLLIGWVHGIRESYGDVMMFLTALNVVQCVLSTVTLTWKRRNPHDCVDVPDKPASSVEINEIESKASS